MSVIRFISWNVLHISHELKYNPNSIVLQCHPDETLRLKKIIELLREHTIDHTVICLQECSSEMLNLVSCEFNKTHNLISQKIPKSKDEYLITLTPKFLKFSQEKKRIPKGANGLSIVVNDFLKIVNCHFKPQFTVKTETVLESLVKECDSSLLTVAAGDFNETSKAVKRTLGSKFHVPYFGRSYKKRKCLDFIVFNLDIKYRSGIIDSSNLSDHRPVVLEIF